MDTDLQRRETARKRVTQRREFIQHVTVYLVVNAAIVAVWALTGGGYFWPAWVLFGWGVGLVLHALSVIGPLRDVTEEDVDRELTRMGER
jgi:fatty acid desaturase